MSILDTFYILFDSDASKLDKGLGESEKKATGLIDKLKGVDKEGAKAGAGLYDLIGKAAGLLGVGLSIGALVAGIRSTAAANFELGKLAEQFRSTAAAIDEFRDAAALIGINEETSIGSIKALDTAVQDTALGLGRAKKVFEEIGVSATDAAGKARPTMQVMADLADKLKGMERGKQIRVMERLGLDPSLLKLFNADFVALQRRMAEVDKASGFNLDQAAKRSNEFIKATKGLTLEVNTLKMYLEKLSEGFKIAVMPYFTEAIGKATKYVKMFVDYLLQHGKFVEGVFIAVGAAIAYFLVPAAISGAIAIWAMIAPFLLIGLAAAAVIAVFALLYDDIMNFIEGNDSLIGQILTRWPLIGKVAEQIGEYVKGLVSVLQWFAGILMDIAEIGYEGWKMLLSAFMDTEIFKAAVSQIQGMIEILTEAFKVFGDAASFVWDAIVERVKTVIGFIGKVVDVLKAVGGFISGGLGEVKANMQSAQEHLAQASGSPLASQTSNSISNTRGGNKTTSVSVGKVEVHTQATDAQGISKAIGGSMQTQMRQAANNFDDGVLA